MVTVEGNWADFTFFRPGADRVFLAGDFNHWREEELPMSSENDGYWHARVRLPSGEFKFRYCADGAWYADYAAFGVEPGRFGLDSVVRIAPPLLHVAAGTPGAAAETVAA
jgi:1,4-alpha-glucan branching enzyme